MATGECCAVCIGRVFFFFNATATTEIYPLSLHDALPISAGIGDPAPIEYVRGAMAGRINVHSKGRSGCRLEITQTMVDMLNKGVTPFVCQKGSVGACGDLAPMSQIALLMLGEGQAYYKGELLDGKLAMERAGIPIRSEERRVGKE